MKVIRAFRYSLLYLLLINGWNLVRCNENENKENEELRSNKRKAIELDISKRKTTKEFYYHEDSERRFGFYVVKSSYVFQGAKRSGTFLSGVWFKQHIWTSKDEDGYANIVIVNGVGKAKATVTILHKNGNTKEFRKSGLFKKFEEKKLNLVNQNKNVRLIVSNDDNNKENQDNNEHILLKNSNGDPNLNFIKDGVKCVEVKYKNLSAWIYGDQDNQEYPRALYYMPNKVVLFFNEFFQIYNYLGNSCELLYDSKMEPFVLSMDDDTTSSRYDYYNNGTDTVAFIAKEGYMFNELKFLRSWVHSIRLDKNIWKANNISEYATKVVMKRNRMGKNSMFKKTVIVYLATGERVVYDRIAWGFRWKLEGKSKHVVRSLVTEKIEFPHGLKVITRFDNNTNVKLLKENDSTKFRVYKYHSDDGIYYYKFEFNQDAECVSFQYNDMPVWKYDENSKTGYPKSITYITHRNKKEFKVYFSEELQYVYKCSGRIMDLLSSRSLKRNK